MVWRPTIMLSVRDGRKPSVATGGPVTARTILSRTLLAVLRPTREQLVGKMGLMRSRIVAIVFQGPGH